MFSIVHITFMLSRIFEQKIKIKITGYCLLLRHVVTLHEVSCHSGNLYILDNLMAFQPTLGSN